LGKDGINFKIEGKYDATAYYSDSKKIVYFDFVESLDDEIFETETIEEPIPTETIEEPIPTETIEDPFQLKQLKNPFQLKQLKII